MKSRRRILHRHPLKGRDLSAQWHDVTDMKSMRGIDAGPYGGHVRVSAEARGDDEGVQDGGDTPSFSSVVLRRLRWAPHRNKIAAGMVRMRGRCARGSRRRGERSAAATQRRAAGTAAAASSSKEPDSLAQKQKFRLPALDLPSRASCVPTRSSPREKHTALLNPRGRPPFALGSALTP
jgi:hypothetical protein